MLLGPVSLSIYRHHVSSAFKSAQQQIETVTHVIKKRLSQTELPPNPPCSSISVEKVAVTSAEADFNAPQEHKKDLPLCAQFERINAQATRPSAHPLEQIGLPLEGVCNNYLYSFKEGQGLYDALNVYIPLQAQETAHSHERFSLIDRVHDFLDSQKTALLLVGKAGSGKSAFNRNLVRTLWEKYVEHGDADDPIPVCIPVNKYAYTDLDLIEKYLLDQQFSQTDIDMLREKNQFIFIVEGLEEGRNRAYIDLNRILDRWNAKLIVSVRPEYVEKGAFSLLQKPGPVHFLQTYWLAPLSDTWIQKYIQAYIQHVGPNHWNVARYQKVLDDTPTLKAAIRRPALLHMALQVLPNYIATHGRAPTKEITLYDQWMANWLERCDARLQSMSMHLTEDEKAVFAKFQPYLKMKGLYASQQLAIALTKNRTVQAFYNPDQDAIFPEAWQQFWGNNEANKRLVLFNMPLLRQGSRYGFIHSGMQAYLVVNAICGPQSHTGPLNVHAVLNQLYLVDKPDILDLLVERAVQFPAFKNHLYAWVEASKITKKIGLGAANAMTVLVRMGEIFTGANLQNVHIPGADLRYGLFDHADFTGANLSHTQLQGIWLRHARLNATLLQGARFDAIPFLAQKRPAKTCLYSSNGAYFAVGIEGDTLLGQGATIRLYRTYNWKIIHTFTLESAHIDSKHMAFSSDSAQLLVADTGKVVRRWQVPLGVEANPFYLRKADSVLNMVYSPNAPLLAIEVRNEEGCRIELWDMDAHAKVYETKKRSSAAQALAFSPNGAWLAIAVSPKQGVALLDIPTKQVMHTFSYDRPCNHMAFSPASQQLALCEYGNRLSLWSVASGARVWKTLYGEGGTQVAFSPNGRLIAAISARNSDDGQATARVWYAESGALFYVQKGHTQAISALAFSPDGTQLATSSMDKTVRLSKVPTEVQKRVAGHTQAITGMAFSPDGGLLATCGNDRTICLWAMPGGKLIHRFWRDKKDPSSAPALHFSPNGKVLMLRDAKSDMEFYKIHEGNTLLQSGSRFAAYSTDALIFSADGRKRAMKKGNLVSLWDVQKRKKIRELLIPDLHHLVHSQDSQYLLALCIKDKVVTIRELEANQVLHTFQNKNRHTSILDATYSPSSQQLAMAHSDHTVTVWNAQTEKKQSILYGHTDTIREIIFSPDGAWLATTSADRTLRIWNASSGTCIGMLQIGHVAIKSMDWYIDVHKNVYIATGSDDSIVRLWHVQEHADTTSISLCWVSGQAQLLAEGATFEQAQRLSQLNLTLLAQCGAVLQKKHKEAPAKMQLPPKKKHGAFSSCTVM